MDSSKKLAIFQAGMLAVKKAEKALWWDWDERSTIFFWSLSPDYQDIAWEGLAPMFDGPPPKNMEGQPPYRESGIKEKVKEKLQ